jgi:hypothetical protein
MRTFGQLDFEELTTVRSTISEPQPRRKPEGNIRDDSDLDEVDDSYDEDSSNPSLPGVTTTEYYTENGADIEREENNEINDDEENDDDDDYYSDDDDGDDDEDGGGDDDDDEDDDDDYDNDNGDDDDNDNVDDDHMKAKKPEVNYEGKRRMYGKKSKQHETLDETTFQTLKKSRNFEDSVEHGRQRTEDDPEDFPASGTRKEGDGSTLTITDTPGRARSALERDLATFLKNESPEAEDQESRTVTKRIRKENYDSNTKKNKASEFYAVRNLQQTRHLEKKASIPQKVKYSNFTVIFMHALKLKLKSVILIRGRINFPMYCLQKIKRKLPSIVYCLSRLCITETPTCFGLTRPS